jgi:hypothetical protein
MARAERAMANFWVEADNSLDATQALGYAGRTVERIYRGQERAADAG